MFRLQGNHVQLLLVLAWPAVLSLARSSELVALQRTCVGESKAGRSKAGLRTHSCHSIASGWGWGWVEEGVEAYQAAHVAKPTGQTQAGSAPAPPNVSWLAGTLNCLASELEVLQPHSSGLTSGDIAKQVVSTTDLSRPRWTWVSAFNVALLDADRAIKWCLMATWLRHG